MRISFVILMCFIADGYFAVQAQEIIPPPGFAPGATNGAGVDTSLPPPILKSDPYPRYGIDEQPSDASSDPSESMSGRRRSFRAYTPPRRMYVDDSRRSPGPLFMPYPSVWMSVEGLIWWTKGNPVPVPLVVEGQALGSGPVVLGNQTLNAPSTGGGRFTLGLALTHDHAWGFEGSYFFLNTSGAGAGVASDGTTGSPPLSFPFFNAKTSGEDYSPIANPGNYAGIATVSTQTMIQGADANIMHVLVGNGETFRFDLMGGFRYLNLQENLYFDTDSPNVSPNPTDFFHTFDAFQTRNNFYGGQIGGRVSLDDGRFFWNATGKLGLGGTFSTVNISGGTFTNYQGPYIAASGAYLTQPTNIGVFNSSQFAVVPELNTNFGFYITPFLKLTIGYSFLYISSVARPGDQIDRVINPTQAYAITGTYPAVLSGVARPAPVIHFSDFWAQGLNLGLELRY